MQRNVRRVWVIQRRSTGRFLTEDLFEVMLLRHAGRCYDLASAESTAHWNLGDDYDLFSFFEADDRQPDLLGG